MNLETKQRREIDRVTFILGIIVLVLFDVIAFLGFFDTTGVNMTLIAVRLVADILITIVFVVAYMKGRTNPVLSRLSIACMFVAYALLVLTSKNVYFYAFIYLIMIVVMLYSL